MMPTESSEAPGEEVPWSNGRLLWRSHPGPHVVLPPILAGGILVSLGLWLPRTINLPDGRVPLLLVPVGLLLAGVWALYAWRTTYVVTTGRLYRRQGLVREQCTEVPLSEVTAVGHVRSGIDRVFDAGTVEVAVRTESGGTEQLAMEHVRHPEYLDDLLTELCLNPETPAATDAVPTGGEEKRRGTAAPNPKGLTANRSVRHSEPAEMSQSVEDSGVADVGSEPTETYVSDEIEDTSATRNGDSRENGVSAPTRDGRFDVRVINTDGITLLRVIDENALSGVSPGDEVRLSLPEEREQERG
jgi:hypothetical protein